MVATLDMRNAFGAPRHDLLETGLRDALPKRVGLFAQLHTRNRRAQWGGADGAEHARRVGTGLPQGGLSSQRRSPP